LWRLLLPGWGDRSLLVQELEFDPVAEFLPLINLPVQDPSRLLGFGWCVQGQLTGDGDMLEPGLIQGATDIRSDLV
jgi:hypothetical protein